MMTHEDSAMSDFARSHKRHHDYTYRLPTPPRILVPPPTLTSEMPELQIGVAANAPDEEIDTSFLRDMSLESIVQKNTLLEWAYERRRQAQMILPWLYLGPLPAAKDREFLAREGITMTLAIRTRDTSMNGAIQVGREVCDEVATIEAINTHMLVGHFPQTARMINQHIAKVRQLAAGTENPRMGKVLVFCESGNEKSAAVVAAYLMELMDDFDHIKSMQVCQAQRFCVNFDDSTKNCLRSYWDILQAKRAVASSRAGLLRPIPDTNSYQQNQNVQLQYAPTAKQKRSIEDTIDDDDVEMGGGLDLSDVLRFQGRDITPFQDSYECA